MFTIRWLIVFLAIVIGSISGVTAQSDSNSIRIATYNLSEGSTNLIEDTANLIARSGANIILLQYLDANEAYLIARLAKLDVAFFLVTDEAKGLAVLSQQTITFDDGHILTDPDNLSAVQRVQILIGNERLLTLYNVGLGFNQNKKIAMTEQQLGEIFRIMVNDNPNGVLLDQKIIVGGAFNDISGSSVEQQMKTAGLSDPFLGTPLKDSATFVNSTIQSRADYLWTLNLTPVGVSVVENPNSDYRMAFVEIQLNSP